MKRALGWLVALALVLPHMAATPAVATPVMPVITGAGWGGDGYSASWTVPRNEEGVYRFQGRLDGVILDDDQFSSDLEESEASGDSAVFQWYGSWSEERPVGEHTFEVRSYDPESDTYSGWASRTITVRPELPISVEVSPRGVVAYNTLCTASVTAPVGKRVTVRWVNPRESEQSGPPVTFESGSCTYTFRARFSGLIWVEFEGDETYDPTTAEYGVATRAIMSAAYAPVLARRNAAFTVWSTITPKQSTSQWVRFYCYRYERQSNGSYSYVLRKTVTPRVRSYSATKTKMYQTFSLPSAGRWKIVPGYFGPATYPFESQGAADYITIR